jgi:methionyl aminopeptidase
MANQNIKLKTDLTTIKNLRESCRRLARVVKMIGENIKPGVSLKSLDEIAFKLITESPEGKRDKDKPALLNFQPTGASFPYPASFCISANDGVVHGIPDEYILKAGDIVSIDGGLDHKGMISDHAVTFPVDKISKENEELLSVTKGALMAGIKVAVAGNYVNDISRAIENYIKKEGDKINKKFGIVKVFAGHGVGYRVHEEPLVPNFDDGVKGPKLVPGMVLAIEPIVNSGSEEVYLAEDGYTFKTVDGKNSAHFEHTILITKDKPEILTVI